MKIQIRSIDGDFSVCKVSDYSQVNLRAEYCFLGKTEEENSLVCLTKDVPDNVSEREDGWKAFRIQGVLDFSLIGILSEISTLLAENRIGIFAISTYNTDYILTKRDNYEKAMRVLEDAGYAQKDNRIKNASDHTVEIRPVLNTDDWLAISHVYEQSWKHAYRGIIPDTWLARIPSGQWANGLKAPDRLSLLLIEDGKICGSASYSHARMEEMKGYGEIISIYLLPEMMHKGYGYQLMQAVISALYDIGYQKVYLWVLEENKNARRFYERFGFVQKDWRQMDIYDGKEVAELMYVYEIE